MRHPNPEKYPNQSVFVVMLDNYAYLVPYIKEAGELKSTSPSKADLAKFKAAATATFIKDRRINIRLSTPDLMDIQARALEEGIPYQTFIASILHKYAAVRLFEKSSNLTRHRTTPKRAAT